MKITINEVNYEVIENHKDGLDMEILTEKLTDYFNDFDYIFGDWAYGKLRLKGFNDQKNKNFKPINDVNNIKKYLNDSCAYGCRYFIIKKIEN